MSFEAKMHGIVHGIERRTYGSILHLKVQNFPLDCVLDLNVSHQSAAEFEPGQDVRVSIAVEHVPEGEK